MVQMSKLPSITYDTLLGKQEDMELNLSTLSTLSEFKCTSVRSNYCFLVQTAAEEEQYSRERRDASAKKGFSRLLKTKTERH